MRKFLTIVKFTVADILHQKSFFILLAICIGFVLLLRGCYKGNYVVNGQAVTGVTVAWHASIIAFHVVSAGVLLIAAVLSMSMLRRDREDGTVAYMLSRPIDRSAYVLGRAAGLWIVSFGFMFVLHLTISIITWVMAGGMMPGYLAASLVCSVNVLFMVLCICLFSLVLPDFIAGLAGIGVAAISYISDSLFNAMHSSIVQSAMGGVQTTTSGWRIVWPKIASLQFYAGSLIDNSQFHMMGPVHPGLVMALYCCAAGAGLVFVFRTREL
jgi:ABC-type transport system involved in multi-copper enzyme maturation permease subunit